MTEQPGMPISVAALAKLFERLECSDATAVETYIKKGANAEELMLQLRKVTQVWCLGVQIFIHQYSMPA